MPFVSRFDVHLPNGWASRDLAEVLVVYTVGYKSDVYEDAQQPNRWQLGASNNVWLHLDGERYWVNFRSPWGVKQVAALGVLLEKLYGLKITWGADAGVP